MRYLYEHVTISILHTWSWPIYYFKWKTIKRKMAVYWRNINNNFSIEWFLRFSRYSFADIILGWWYWLSEWMKIARNWVGNSFFWGSFFFFCFIIFPFLHLLMLFKLHFIKLSQVNVKTPYVMRIEIHTPPMFW